MSKKIILMVGSIVGRADEFYQNNPDLVGKIIFYTILDESVSDIDLKKAKSSFQKVLLCNFDNDASILRTIFPYRHNIVSIGCIGDTSVEHMAHIVAFFPDVNVPTQESIFWTHDKYKMRQLLAVINPDITVKSVSINLQKHQDEVLLPENWLFPAMLKPTNLHSSILTQKINNVEELKKTLNNIASDESLNNKNITFLLEEFIDGAAYSIDGVVDDHGSITFYPVIDQVIGVEVGFEEYFVYKSSIPTILTYNDISDVHQVVEQLLDALSLRSSHFHVELKKTVTGFKIIEIAPRYGFMRNILYMNGYGIDIIGNEHFVKFDNNRVQSQTKFLNYCAVYKIFPKSEGVVASYEGLDDVKNVDGIVSATPNKHLAINGQFTFAKNGGNPMFIKIIVQHKDLNKFILACKFVEDNVSISMKV